jgi:hypothetical protein
VPDFGHVGHLSSIILQAFSKIDNSFLQSCIFHWRI